MKKLFLLTATVLLSYISNGQTVNGKPFSEITTPYCQIVGLSKPFTNKVTIYIDFGQENKIFDSSDDGRIMDENGKSVVFNSMIDALNFMTKNGYRFVAAYVITTGGQNVYHYLMEKSGTSTVK